MKARPILFQRDMVRAILDGRKTQTRRVVKPQPQGFDAHTMDWGCPYGHRGDLLWVREAHYVWSAGYVDGSGRRIDYRATEPDSPCGGWTPSIHMPRWASRLTLRVAGVRVQRLQDIDEGSCWDEGIEAWLEHDSNLPRYSDGTPNKYNNARQAFAAMWGSINGPDSWGANPWVWVIEFEPIQANVDEILKAAA